MTVPPAGVGPQGARDTLLSRALAARFGPKVRVASMRLAPGGNSRETWIADVEIDGAPRRVVFRCDPDHWIRPQEMQREIGGLRLAAGAGVPAPRVLVSSAEHDVGRPYVVTDFVEGTAIARRVLREPEFSEARARFAAECGEILARLHSAPAGASALSAYDPITELDAFVADSAYPSPVLMGATRWLADHRPAPRRSLCPVHRDFRLGNLMMTGSGVAAVLDWETCQLSDPEEDLAWLCSRSWRYGSDQPVGGLGRLEDLLAAYERASGRPVDLERLHWWSVFAETRWGLASIVRQRPGSPGDAMEQAAIMRRGCRQELNVLLELKRYVSA